MNRITQHSAPAVLIVGAGPVGLTLAVQLQRLGVPYRLVERNDGPSTTTKAMAIHSRTLEIFREIGIADVALSAGHPIRRFRVESNGRTILTYDFTLLDAAYPFLLSLPQPKTESLLLQRLASLGGNVEWRTSVTELDQSAHGASATLIHANGRHERVNARWIAGCDGARSTVRRSLGLSFDGAAYHRFFMLTDVDIEWNGQCDEGAFFLGSQKGYIAVAPLDDRGRYRLFVEMPFDLPPQGQRPALDLAVFQELCDGRGPAMRLSHEASATAAAFQHRRVARQQVGRVFLLGDAAHIGSPIGGQYMNLGIAEAHNLAWKLAYVEQGAAEPALLDSYDAERTPVAVEANRTAHVLTQLVTVRSRPLVALRDMLLPRLTRADKVKKKLPWMISGHRYQYRASPLVDDARSAAPPRRRHANRAAIAWPLPCAGDLAPDIELWQARGVPPKRLIDLFRNTFTLLLFADGDDSCPCINGWMCLGKRIQHAYPCIRAHLVLDALEAPVDVTDISTILDPDWRLHNRYGAKGGAIVLIRPDGYIGFIGTNEAALTRYLTARSTLQRSADATMANEPAEAVGAPA